MKQQFSAASLLVLIITTLLLSGCVTREYVTGANNVDTERVINTEKAAMARLKLAIEYLRQNNIAAAKQNLDRAAAIDDTIDGIQSSYAFYYQKVGESVRADAAYRKALKQFPDNASIRNNYGAFLCDANHYDQAQLQFVRALGTDTNAQMAQTHENAALCALRAKRWSIAQHHFNAVLKYEPYRARSILGLAKANIRLNNMSEAKQDLKRYSKVYAVTSQSLWLNILFEHQQNNLEKVRMLGLVLQSQYPQSVAASNFIAKNFND